MPKPGPVAGSPDEPIVQQLLAERRELKVVAERLRLEIRDLSARVGRPDPRLRSLEAENRRLRDELASARNERDHYREAVIEVNGRLALELKRAPR